MSREFTLTLSRVVNRFQVSFATLQWTSGRNLPILHPLRLANASFAPKGSSVAAARAQHSKGHWTISNPMKGGHDSAAEKVPTWSSCWQMGQCVPRASPVCFDQLADRCPLARSFRIRNYVTSSWMTESEPQTPPVGPVDAANSSSALDALRGGLHKLGL